MWRLQHQQTNEHIDSTITSDCVDGTETKQGLLSVHPHHIELHEEVHARPFPVLAAPVRISHLVVTVGEEGKDAQVDHLRDLCRHFDVELPKENASCYNHDFGMFELRYARHTEFCTYTLIQRGPYEHPFEEPVISLAPPDWLASMQGHVLTGVHVAFEPRTHVARSRDELHELFEGHRLIGSAINQERGTVWSTFQLHSDGFERILIHDHALNDCQAGRLVQRLLDLETYRLMALLALPVARDAGPQLSAMDQQLDRIIDELRQRDSLNGQQQLLAELTSLAGRSEHLRTRTNYRFSATRAYCEIADRRLAELREKEIEGLQTIGEFLSRRTVPAMRTCEAVHRRMDDLALRIDRAAELLRTKIELALRQQNQQVLESMNRRAKLQLRLQTAVEGLSVIAISYYLLGLLKYEFAAVEKMGLPLNPTIATGLALPFVVLLVWLGVHRLRHRLSGGKHGNTGHIEK